MPAYGSVLNSKSIYPGQSAFPVGYGGLPSGPVALQNTQMESLVLGYKSIPICVAAGMGYHGFTQRQINWLLKYGVIPASITLELQGAADDVDGDYQQVDTSSAIANSTQTVQSNMKFFRIYVAALVGACTLAVKISAM